MSYTEHFYKSSDGLDLYYRVYGNASDRLPIVCLSGITRNCGDFDEFAEGFSKDRQIFCLDYRGRGQSHWDTDYKNYNPQTYLGDIFVFLTTAQIEKAVFVGTSFGGLLCMGLSGLTPQYIAGVILNDVGPDISDEGGSRIAGYIETDVRYQTIEDVAAAQKSSYSAAYPDVDKGYWISTARVGFKYDDKDQNFKPNYDLAIGKALIEQTTDEQPIDLWPFFETMKAKPLLAIRGALSDVLSEETFQKMQKVNPDMQHLTLANRGHVPLLNEPLALKEITGFLETV